jgi:hypothetical protein
MPDDKPIAAVRVLDETVEGRWDLAFPDWVLLERLAGVLRAARPQADIRFSAIDTRGSFEALDVESLRAIVASADERPYELRMFAVNGDEEFSVSITPNGSSTARVVSTDQMMVDHYKARFREVFLTRARASHSPPETYEEASLRVAEEYALEQIERPRYVNVVEEVLPPRPKPSFWARHGTTIERWALALVPVILGVLLTVWFLGK